MSRVHGIETKAKAFMKLWRLCGSPVLGVIGPISSWTLPDGVFYDKHVGTFVDDASLPVDIDWEDQDTTNIAFLPQGVSFDVGLEIGGVTSTRYTNVILLWTAETEENINAAWGIVIGENLYTIERWSAEPIGVPTPSTLSVSLAEGE